MLPNGWKNTIVSETCELINGRGFKPHEWSRTGLPIIRIQNLNGSREYNFYNGEFDKKILVHDGELLFAWSGSKGTSFGPHIWHGSDGVLNYHTWKVLPKPSANISFLNQYFRYITSHIENKSHGASALVHTQKGYMENISILLPPLAEQKKIAAILSTWDRAIEGTEKLLANSQQQKKALMQQLLTGKKRLPGFTGEWRNTSFYEICTLNPKSPKIEELTQISFIPMDGVSNDARISDVMIRAFKKENNGFSYFQEKDVLVAKITPCFENGKGGYLNELPTQHGFGSTEFHVLRATANADGKFIYYITTSERFRILGEMNMQGSAGQKRVPKDFIERFSVNLPPPPEQKAIAAVLTIADEEITVLESDLSRLRQEKKALMQQLLTGKRRVTVD